MTTAVQRRDNVNCGSPSEEIDLLSIPRMSGDELLKELRDLNAHVKVIVTSGLVTDVVEKRLEALDVSAVLPKPIDWQELVRTVRKVLEGG